MKRILVLLFSLLVLPLSGWEREPVWPAGKMPDRQQHQIDQYVQRAEIKRDHIGQAAAKALKGVPPELRAPEKPDADAA